MDEHNSAFATFVDQARREPAAFRELDRARVLAAAREFARRHWDSIHSLHDHGASGERVSRALSDSADTLVTGVLSMAMAHVDARSLLASRSCLIALGSYARQELAPQSDLDVCLIHDGALETMLEQLNAFLVPFLWDLGYRVGFMVRSIDEMCRLALSDPRDFTSSLTSRLVAGDSMVYARLRLRLRGLFAETESKGVIAQLIRQRFEDLPPPHRDLFAPEPNIKEGAGGLRDYQTAMWLFSAGYGVNTLEHAESSKMLTAEEHIQTHEALEFLLRVRNELHFTAGAQGDTLTFALQQHMAQRFGSGGPGDVPAFMQDYYAAASVLRAFMRLAARTWEHHERRTGAIAPSSMPSGIELVKGQVTIPVHDHDWFARRPARLMEVFWECARHEASLSHDTERALQRNLYLAGEAFQCNDTVRQLFCNICNYPQQAGRVLRLMANAGLLGRYIPEYEAIQGVIRYKDFHHYPVDEHTLRAVEALAHIPDSDEPVYRALRQQLALESEPYLLVLSILFHDLGKAEGEVHVEASRRIVYEAGHRMGLREDEKIGRAHV